MLAQFAGVYPSIAITLLELMSSSIAPAQTTPAPAIAEQLRTQYKIVRMAEDANGPTIVEPGTVLTLQKGGLLGVPPTSIMLCPSKYQDGEMHNPAGLCVAMVKQTSRFFQKGEKVYPMKVDVNLKKEQISFRIVACDTCNGVDPPTFFKSDVVFQFAKGYLETAATAQVQEAINQVLAVDAAPPPVAEAPPPDPPAAARETPPTAIVPPERPRDQAPPTVEIGQTTDQVVGAMGQPQKIAKAGAKQIYFYDKLKVTFTNGKVSDVD